MILLLKTWTISLNFKIEPMEMIEKLFLWLTINYYIVILKYNLHCGYNLYSYIDR